MIYIHKSIYRYFLGERNKSRVQNMEPFSFKIGSCNSWRCWENSFETWYKSVVFGCWFWNNRITCIRFSWSCTFFCIIYILEFKILSCIIWTIFLFLSNVTTLLFSWKQYTLGMQHTTAKHDSSCSLFKRQEILEYFIWILGTMRKICFSKLHFLFQIKFHSNFHSKT